MSQQLPPTTTPTSPTPSIEHTTSPSHPTTSTTTTSTIDDPTTLIPHDPRMTQTPVTFLSTLTSYYTSLTNTLPQLLDYIPSPSTPIPLSPAAISSLVVSGALASLLFARMLFATHTASNTADTYQQAKILIYFSFHSERFSLITLLSKLPHAQALSIPTTAQLHEAFAAFLEHDEIGTMSFSCFTQHFLPEIFASDSAQQPAYPSVVFQRFFTLFDRDNDQQIDFFDFLATITMLFTTTTKDMFAQAYECFDIIGSNALTLDQACEIINTLNPIQHNSEFCQFLRINGAIRTTITKNLFAQLCEKYVVESYSLPTDWNGEWLQQLALFLHVQYVPFNRQIVTFDEPIRMEPRF